MVGLSVVLLETTTMTTSQQRQHAPSSAEIPQVISKTTLVKTSNGGVGWASSSSSPSSRASSTAAAAAAAAAPSSFLQRCFLCHRDLADGRDIYIYRGDRAFCSDECRCRYILMDEEASMNCVKDAVAPPSRRRRRFCVLTI